MAEAKRKTNLLTSCAYCGSGHATTRDHVPPRVIFWKPYPHNLTTVPCCINCNQRWSPLDEEFRTALSMLAGINTAGTQRLWRERVLPGLRRNRRQREAILKQLRTEIWTQNLITGGFEKGYVIRVPADRYHAMIKRITRGLHSSLRGMPLLEDIPISVQRWRHLDTMNQFIRLATVRHFGNQFAYALFSAEDHPVDTLWLYAFHEQEYASAATGILAEESEE